MLSDTLLRFSAIISVSNVLNLLNSQMSFFNLKKSKCQTSLKCFFQFQLVIICTYSPEFRLSKLHHGTTSECQGRQNP